MHVAAHRLSGAFPLRTCRFPATSSFLASPDDHASDAARRADPAGKQRLVRGNLRLARREARLSDHRLRKGYARRVQDDSVSVIRGRNERLRKRITRLERRAGSTASAPLQAIAACESGGNPTAIGGGGQ